MIILLFIQIIRDEYQLSIVENSHFEYIHSQLRMVMSVTDIVQQENLYHPLIITSFVVEPRILFLTPSILFGTNNHASSLSASKIATKGAAYCFIIRKWVASCQKRYESVHYSEE
jgi:hypothetical protein